MSPWDEGLDVFSSGKHVPMKSYIQSLKPLSLPFQGAKVTVGKSEEGFMSVSPLNNFGFISPFKKTFHGTGYFLRSCTKLTGDYPISSGFGLGKGISGLCFDGLPIKDSDQNYANGALRAVLAPAKVTL